MRELSMNETRNVVGGWDSTDNPTDPNNGIGDFSSKPGGGIFGRIGDAVGKIVDGVVAVVDRIADAVVGDDGSAREGTTSCAPGQDLRRNEYGTECVTPVKHGP